MGKNAEGKECSLLCVVKVVPDHTKQAIALLLLSVGFRWRSAVSFRPLSLYPWYPLKRGMCGSHGQSVLSSLQLVSTGYAVHSNTRDFGSFLGLHVEKNTKWCTQPPKLLWIFYNFYISLCSYIVNNYISYVIYYYDYHTFILNYIYNIQYGRGPRVRSPWHRPGLTNMRPSKKVFAALSRCILLVFDCNLYMK
jgi:hypothetical protein